MRGLLIAITEPSAPEREADYHRWYDTVQIPAFLAMPGIARVTRYRTSATQLNPTVAVPHQYMVLYEIEVNDMAGLSAFADLQFATYQRGSVGNRSPGSDAYNQQTSRTAYYLQVDERVGRDDFAPESVLMVYTDPATPEQDTEYNRWYSYEHLQDVTSVPGYVAATRFRLTDLNMGRQFKPWPVPRGYLAVYELDCKGPEALAAAGKALRARPNPTNSPALGRPTMTQFYERIAGPFMPATEAKRA